MFNTSLFAFDKQLVLMHLFIYLLTETNDSILTSLNNDFHSYKIIYFFTCVSYAEAHNRYRLDVRPSVCPSHAGTVSKRLNVLS